MDDDKPIDAPVDEGQDRLEQHERRQNARLDREGGRNLPLQPATPAPAEAEQDASVENSEGDAP